MSGEQTILIVEDDSLWRSVLKEELESEGYKVLAYADYSSSYYALQKQRFDLVVLDLKLTKSAPVLDGERLLRRLAQYHAGTPCIVVSGQGTVHIVRNAFKHYHVIDFLSKEKFDIPDFIKTVKGALQQPQPQTHIAATPHEPVSAATRPVDTVWKLEYLSRLLEILCQHFNAGELRSLCFHLGVNYDDLEGEGKKNKAREFILYLKRHKRLPSLVETGKRLRPEIVWQDSPPPAKTLHPPVG